MRSEKLRAEKMETPIEPQKLKEKQKS